MTRLFWKLSLFVNVDAILKERMGLNIPVNTVIFEAIWYVANASVLTDQSLETNILGMIAHAQETTQTLKIRIRVADPEKSDHYAVDGEHVNVVDVSVMKFQKCQKWRFMESFASVITFIVKMTMLVSCVEDMAAVIVEPASVTRAGVELPVIVFSLKINASLKKVERSATTMVSVIVEDVNVMMVGLGFTVTTVQPVLTHVISWHHVLSALSGKVEIFCGMLTWKNIHKCAWRLVP